MATFKFTLLFCAAFLVYQAQAVPQPKTHSVEDIDVIGILKKIVKAVEGSLDWLVSDAEEIINNITPEKWDEVRTKIIDVTKKVLGKALDKILADVANIGSESSDAGKKLASCIISARDDILSVPITFWDDSTKCISDDLLAIVKLMGPLVKDLEGIQTEAKAAADGIDNCDGSGISALLCVAQVAGDLLTVVGEMPDKIKPELVPVITELKSVLKDAAACVKAEVPSYFTNAGKVLDKVATCAAA